MTNHHVRFEGPAALALRVATVLADAEGVELVSSDQPVAVDHQIVTLSLTVAGTFAAVADAVAKVRGEISPGASIEITDA